MKKGLLAAMSVFEIGIFFCLSPLAAADAPLDLQSVVQFALKHNPNLHIAQRNIQTEKFGIDAARSDMLPKVNFGSDATRFRYPRRSPPSSFNFPSRRSFCPILKGPSMTPPRLSGSLSIRGEGLSGTSGSPRRERPLPKTTTLQASRTSFTTSRAPTRKSSSSKSFSNRTRPR